MTRLRFTKMHGLGNDFVMLEGVRQTISMTPELARRLADRRFGIGCDQVLLVGPPLSANADFSYRIFNADGGEVEQCGNGARCFARFVRDEGLTDKAVITVETRGGVIRPRIEPDGSVTVDMGAPRFEPADIPFVAAARAPVYDLDVNGETVSISAISMGNPHAVQCVNDVDAAPVTTQGPHIEKHARFPNRVNAGYLQVVDRSHIHLRVWERGVGETLACGTGACAAVVAGRLRGLLDDRVQVSLRGGDLVVDWKGMLPDGQAASVFMTGPVARVFNGEWNGEWPG